MKIIFSTILCFLIILISCKKAEVKVEEDPGVSDYREKYFGNYNCLVITTTWSMGQSQSDVDTLYTIVKVNKFEGFSTNAGNNYRDIEHKVGIIVKEPFNSNVNYGYCDGVTFYYDEFIHPTIALDGVLTYPEYGCNSHQYFNGKFENDSIQVSCIFTHMSSNWSQRIVGIKIQ